MDTTRKAFRFGEMVRKDGDGIVIETNTSMILQFIDGCGETCRSRLKKEPRPPGVRPAETARDETTCVDPPKECPYGRPQSDKIDARRLASCCASTSPPVPSYLLIPSNGQSLRARYEGFAMASAAGDRSMKFKLHSTTSRAEHLQQ